MEHCVKVVRCVKVEHCVKVGHCAQVELSGKQLVEHIRLEQLLFSRLVCYGNRYGFDGIQLLGYVQRWHQHDVIQVGQKSLIHMQHDGGHDGKDHLGRQRQRQ